MITEDIAKAAKRQKAKTSKTTMEHLVHRLWVCDSCEPVHCKLWTETRHVCQGYPSGLGPPHFTSLRRKTADLHFKNRSEESLGTNRIKTEKRQLSGPMLYRNRLGATLTPNVMSHFDVHIWYKSTNTRIIVAFVTLLSLNIVQID